MAEYISTYANSIDAKRFEFMHEAGSAASVKDTRGADHMTRFGAWAARWNHWGNRGALQSLCKGAYVDTPYLRCFEEQGYEERLAALVSRYRTGDDIYPQRPDFSLMELSRPYDQVYFISNHAYWGPETAFEQCLRFHMRHRYFVPWQCVHFFAVPSLNRAEVYIRVPEWWNAYKPSTLLLTPTPWVFSYYTHLALKGTAREKGLIWAIAVTEFTVFEVLSSLACACDGVTHSRV